MRDFFIKDLGWKLFSLVIATSIWFTVHHILHETSTPLPDTTILPVTYGSLPVTIVSATADVRAFHVMPRTVKVTVTGPASVMGVLQADQLHATVNLTSATLFQGQFVPVEISAPGKVAVTSIDPDRVLVIVPSPTDKKP